MRTAFLLAALVGFVAAQTGEAGDAWQTTEVTSTETTVIEESSEQIVQEVSEEVVTVNDIQEFEELDYTQVWSVDEINNWVMENHGGYEWSAIADQHLISEESRSAYATSIVTGLVDTWSETVSGMPPVCAEGVACREQIFTNLMVDLEAEWNVVLQGINAVMEATVTEVKTALRHGYDDAYDCPPGCHCDNIMIEYDGITRIQTDITASVLKLKETLEGLVVKQTEIIDECEEYVQIDGEWYYDTADRYINPFADSDESNLIAE